MYGYTTAQVCDHFSNASEDIQSSTMHRKMVHNCTKALQAVAPTQQQRATFATITAPAQLQPKGSPSHHCTSSQRLSIATPGPLLSRAIATHCTVQDAATCLRRRPCKISRSATSNIREQQRVTVNKALGVRTPTNIPARGR